MEAQIYNQEGKATGKVKLPETIFGLSWNADLVHQVVTAMQANARTLVAHTKGRGEISGGGKKPWRQKGTGRARHGSIRSPLWRGGGVTFGPSNERNYTQKLNKKMKAKALLIALSQKLRDGEVLFIDTLAFGGPKTAEAQKVLSALSQVNGFDTLISKKKNSALIALSEKDTAVEKSFNNFGNIAVDEVRNLNAIDVLTYKYVIITKPEDAIAFLESKLSQKAEVVNETVESALRAEASSKASKTAPKKKSTAKSGEVAKRKVATK